MSEEGKDIKAAEKEFLEIFEAEDRKVLISFFLKGFLEVYNRIKAQSYVKGEVLNTRGQLSVASVFLRGAQKANSKEEETLELGRALGTLLGMVDFVITSQNVGINKRYSEEILSSVRNIHNLLKQMNKTVNQKFIRRRIERIAKEHRNKLSDEQKHLLAAIAAEFSS